MGYSLSFIGTVAKQLNYSVANKLGLSPDQIKDAPLLNKIAGQTLQTGVNIATSELTRRVANPIFQATQKLDTRLKNITRKGLKTFGLNAFNNESRAHNPLAVSGNLTMWQVWENYKHMNVDGLSRKNFYVLEINDRTNSAPTHNGAKHSQFNLLTTNLTFNSFDIQGEPVQVGSIELDKFNANAKTTLSLTVFDDENGTIKRWAENKAHAIASSDGTFLPPAFSAFEVRIVFGTNIPHSDYYEQIYTMRVQTMPHELSRNEQGLEELQLAFTQVDTFMPHWI